MLQKIKILTCVECGKEFERIHNRQITCSKECGDKRGLEKSRQHARRRREEKLRAKGIDPDKLKKCIECGKEFKPKRSNQRICSDECRLERTRRRNREKWERYVELEKKGEGPLLNGVYVGKDSEGPIERQLPKVNKTRILDFKKIQKEDLYRHIFHDTKEATKLAPITETILEEMVFKHYFECGEIECYRK